MLTPRCASAITWTGLNQGLISLLVLVWAVWWALKGKREEGKREKRRGGEEDEGRGEEGGEKKKGG